MTTDYDLSEMEPAQVNLWLYLHIGDIYAQIAVGARQTIPQARRDSCRESHSADSPVPGCTLH